MHDLPPLPPPPPPYTCLIYEKTVTTLGLEAGFSGLIPHLFLPVYFESHLALQGVWASSHMGVTFQILTHMGHSSLNPGRSTFAL